MEYKEVERLLKVKRTTIYRYVRDGKIRVTKINDYHLIYNDDDVFKLAGITEGRKCVIYGRVSTLKQKNDLNNQIDTLTNFAISNGYIVDKVYKDIASGLSFDRMEFKSMLIDVINHKIKTVIIANKDRFSRISFKMWKELFEYFNCNIIIANETDNTNEEDEKEIFEDIISLIHCFAMKMYSKRRKNKLKLIEENLQIEQ
jgi:predicted site-specific integrase-resolvase